MAISAFGRNEPNPWLLAALDPRDTRPPAQQIAARLREAIDSGAFRPGDLLPSCGSMARRYRVGAATASRALQELAGAGLVRSYKGIGSYVSGGDR